VIAKKLRLTGVQRKYFLTLVEYNNSRSIKQREELFNTLMAIKSQVLPTTYDKDMLEFFSCWYHPIIRDMVGLPDFQSDPAWIAKRIFPSIRPEQAKSSLTLLEKLGLIYFDLEKSCYFQTKKDFSTGPQLGTIGIARFHQMMIENGKQAITRVKKNERDISGVSICIPKFKVKLLKNIIQNFQQQLLESEEYDQKDNEIYQINIQLFPVTQTS